MATSAPASIPDVRRLSTVTEAQLQALADVLVDCVEGGASVSFMLPMTRDKALAFWRKVADGAARGERLLLVAEDAQGIVGTVQVILDQPENQPHRADVAKMLVHRRGRRQGHDNHHGEKGRDDDAEIEPDVEDDEFHQPASIHECAEGRRVAPAQSGQPSRNE